MPLKPSSDGDARILGKNGLATREVARTLASLEPGSRIPTTEQFASNLRVGQGTIQKVLRTLHEVGGVVLEPRGHLGTFLVKRDLSALWSMSGLGTVVGIMPLPNFRELEGLATYLTEVFDAANIQLNLLHVNGARTRIEHMQAGSSDFVVMSQYSAILNASDDAEAPAFIGPDDSYYATDSLAILARADIADISAVKHAGIDDASFDHAALTRSQFGSADVSLVPTPYHRVPDMILSGHIEAAVWHKPTHSIDALGTQLKYVPLKTQSTNDIANQIGRVALVTTPKNSVVRAVLKELVAPEGLAKVQAAVADGTRVPLY